MLESQSVQAHLIILSMEVSLGENNRTTPWFLWPFTALWRLVTRILEITGRFVAVILGIALIAIGVALSLTVIGAIVGVPLALFGFLLLLRGLF